MRWLLLFILLPLLEIWLLIKVGSYIGATLTVVLVILTAVVGIQLIRLQGLSTLIRANARMRAGQVPAQEMGEGLILAVAGLLLLMPGFATDALGFACLIPPLRRRVLKPISRHFRSRTATRHWPPGSDKDHPSDSGRTLEGEYKRDSDDDKRQ